MDLTLLFFLALAGLWATIAIMHQFQNGSGMGAGGAVSGAWAIAALFFGIAAGWASAWYWGCAVTVAVYVIYMRLIQPAVDWLYYRFTEPKLRDLSLARASQSLGSVPGRGPGSRDQGDADESSPDKPAAEGDAPGSSGGADATKAKHPHRKSRAARDREQTIALVLGFFFFAGMSVMFWWHFRAGMENGLLLFDWHTPRRPGGIGIDGLVFRAFFAAMWDVAAILCVWWLFRHRREMKRRAAERVAQRSADRARNKHRMLD